MFFDQSCQFNLNWLTTASDHLKDVYNNLSLTQLITNPTGPNPKDHAKSTLIDLILCNRDVKITAHGVFDLSITVRQLVLETQN